MSEGFALPSGNQLGPNCGVTAVAVAAGVSFQTAWDVMSAGKRGNWKGRSNHAMRDAALRKFGFEARLYSNGGCTLATWARRFGGLVPGRTYMVVTGGHVQLLRDGIVLDQRGPVPVADYWGRNKRVKIVHLILPA